MRATWLLALVLLTASLAYSQVAVEGKVVGTVVDELDQPLNGAEVCTRMSSSAGTVGNCLAITDKAGQFEMDHLPLGTFGIVASKTDDGYTELHQAPGMQTVTLSAGAPQASIVLKLGPKEGILVPVVKDAVTGEPVYNFLVTWHVVPVGSGITGGAGFSRWTRSAPVPAEKQLVMDKVSARGYKTWLANSSSPLQVRAERGEQVSISIELEPESATAAE